MNYSLDGARSQARLDWDALEARSKRAQSLPRRIFALAVIGSRPIWPGVTSADSP
jgi:hypothetical protein